MAETSVPKALEGLTVSKTKELKGVSAGYFPCIPSCTCSLFCRLD